MPIQSHPVYAEFPAVNFTCGAGVAIFHVKSERVVLCYHTLEHYWFLPKGRRDAGEETRRGAEREGFEESGFRNRLLPLPVIHRQPQAAESVAVGEAQLVNVVEPIWTTLLPQSKRTQYLLHWFVAETLPPDLETRMGPPPASRAYQEPPPYPADLLMVDRLALEPDGYEPTRYENTGVDSDEANYMSYLLPIEEAIQNLGKNIMGEVIAVGWERIQARLAAESDATTSVAGPAK
ncbi:Protein btn-1 [Venturia nashicola]|uniref:Protein btn-1 n=1 Tax=Venturia nashicola TaxID=86259 RepID=A0A4Z1NC22_9PEZI|nr:Protein btn-1 [Venturia nashicola]TLD14821.1 Protein btn-1 [Venturia nashicola]